MKATPITDFGAKTKSLAQTLLDTMYDAQGIGLAANQVGIVKKIAVMDCSRGETKPDPYILVNPEVVRSFDIESEEEEGCLSFPSHFAKITRPVAVDIRFQDTDGTWHEKHLDGIESRCAQHEIDHLNGILFIDHCSLIKRKIIIQKMTKLNSLKG